MVPYGTTNAITKLNKIQLDLTLDSDFKSWVMLQNLCRYRAWIWASHSTMILDNGRWCPILRQNSWRDCLNSQNANKSRAKTAHSGPSIQNSVSRIQCNNTIKNWRICNTFAVFRWKFFRHFPEKWAKKFGKNPKLFLLHSIQVNFRKNPKNDVTFQQNPEIWKNRIVKNYREYAEISNFYMNRAFIW